MHYIRNQETEVTMTQMMKPKCYHMMTLWYERENSLKTCDHLENSLCRKNLEQIFKTCNNSHFQY